jgi:biotin carboxyl carrier protein
MKKYNITVNGKAYEVEVEEIGGASTPSYVAPTQPSAPKAAPKAAPKKAPAPATVGTGSISAPMPGTVLDIKVTEGQRVKAGDILLILEAMKMENEIVAPSDGKVSKINTSKGAAVNTGDALITLG